MLLEIAWEACNQVGGIYTVLRSKAPAMVSRWGNRYCLVGPYNEKTAAVEFEAQPLVGPMGKLVKALREQGIRADLGRWLVSGRPQLVLLHLEDTRRYLDDIKYRLWADHGIPTPGDDPLLNDVLAFGEAVRLLLTLFGEAEASRRKIIAHVHEWMAGSSIPMLRKDNWPGSVVFTTHATLLGRYLAMNTPVFYDHLPYFNAAEEAKNFNVEAQHGIERAAAHGSHVFTTVSELTGDECTHLLGRTPDAVLPNGLNIGRFAAVHEFQNLHQQYKEKIHEFTVGHFFPSYHFDLKQTLYFFTSGRYEYRNKGMDLTIESLARLNHRLREAQSPMTVVFFIITRAPTRSVSVGELERRAMLNEFHTTAEAIQQQIGKRLFYEATTGHIPDFNSLVDDYWRLRLRRGIQNWKRDELPPIVTHDLVDDQQDQVLNALRRCNLLNHEHDRVKVVFHPDFITSSSPLLGMEYDQFVRGTHLGVFPSYYEPWGYTPLECMSSGVPAVTSDLAGFGSYLQHMLPDHEGKGVSIVPRRGVGFEESAQMMTNHLYNFCQLSQRERIEQRNAVEAISEHFDWRNLGRAYHEAHGIALDRI
ncbi:MAG: glycosyltransferase [Algisphaera sp.]